jgi:SAM-dependent methyltransferase
VFDRIAELYDMTMFPLPAPYLSLIRHCIGEPPRELLDLGCGSGLLTVPLAEAGYGVTGIDISAKLLEIGRSKTSYVKWLQAAVESVELPACGYDAIVSFEAFHLFANPTQVIRKCAGALRRNGVLGVGWCIYGWESVLRHDILEICAEHDITWGSWGYQTCPSLSTYVTSCRDVVGALRTEEVKVTAVADLKDIAEFLGTTSSVNTLSEPRRRAFVAALQNRFERHLMATTVETQSTYVFAVCRRVLPLDARDILLARLMRG